MDLCIECMWIVTQEKKIEKIFLQSDLADVYNVNEKQIPENHGMDKQLTSNDAR